MAFYAFASAAQVAGEGRGMWESGRGHGGRGFRYVSARVDGIAPSPLGGGVRKRGRGVQVTAAASGRAARSGYSKRRRSHLT